MSEPPFQLRDWDASIPDKFALEQVVIATIDMSINLTGAHTPNGLGLAHEVVSPAEHLVMFGTPAAPLDLPPDFFGTAANMRNQQRPHDQHATQTKFNPVLRSAFIKVLPDRILRLIEVNGSTRHHVHVYDMIADLRVKLPLTNRDLILCKEGVSRAYPRSTGIRPFVADQTRFLGYLTAVGQGLSNLDAVNLLKSAFTSTKTDKADFGPAFAEYLKDHGGIATQTPANWCDFVITFVENRLDHHAETNSAARRGIANAAVAEDEAIVTSISGPLAVEFQAFLAQKNKPTEPPRRSKRKASVISGPAPSGPAQPGDPLYCWTHGAIGHASGGTVNPCLNPAPGHIASAHFRNQQGGKRAN
jgi:hypothetical protein